ncbi:MAG: DegT/DnrJ/EryC1/StrS family aminotransferase [Pseudomonadota bacterium]
MPLSPQPRSKTYASPAIYRRIAAEMLTGRAYNGEGDLARLERAFAELQQTDFALCLPQGRIGIYLALRALVRPGKAVILSPYTIYDVVNMVLAAGAVPLFADVDPLTGNLDPDAVRAALTTDTGAVLATHIHGLSCEIEEIQRICENAGVALIEDCAQCLGGTIGGRPVGSFGDVGIFSFSRAKNVNTIFGGMAVTRDRALHRQMASDLAVFEPEDLSRLVKRTGTTLLNDALSGPIVFEALVFPLVRLDARKEAGIVDRLTGAEKRIEMRRSLPPHYQRRMTPMQARLALMQLPDIECHQMRRLTHARRYKDGLSPIGNLQLPPWNEDGRHTYLSFPVQTANRGALVRHLLDSGRDVRPQYYRNLAAAPEFGAFRRDCPNASRVAARTILLPIYPDYTEAEIDKTIEAIRSFGDFRVGEPELQTEPD